MAKHKFSPTLKEMEDELGFVINNRHHSDDTPHYDDTVERFYTDFRPVAGNTHEVATREYKELWRLRHAQDKGLGIGKGLLQLPCMKTITSENDSVRVIERPYRGFYRFAVNVRLGFGLNISFLFTEDEARQMFFAAKLRPKSTTLPTPVALPRPVFPHGLRWQHAAFDVRSAALPIPPTSSAIRQTADNEGSGFFRLPAELRMGIYTLTLPDGFRKIQDTENFERNVFPGAIGDPSGFYFPLGKDFAIVNVNIQIREEALAVAFSQMALLLDDMDDLVKLLLAIGRIGRANIESLEFPWEGRADSELRWDKISDPDEHSFTLPTLHVAECTQLLKQCCALKVLRIKFETDLMLNKPLDFFRADPGIQALCSVRAVRLEVWSLGDESLDHCPIAQWLKQEIETLA